MSDFLSSIRGLNAQIQEKGFWKQEFAIQSPQDALITLDGQLWLNFCANNYLGLSNDPRLVSAAKRGLDQYGFGMSSVRFICGTQDQHRLLEQRIAEFLGKEDAILYSSCFDANGGLFEALLGEEDAVVSDELNHASLIDGIRLCKARRYRYKNCDMADLRRALEHARREGSRWVFIVTDGVFSMDGTVAPLARIRELADEFQALVIVDDSHAVGFYGPEGKGSPAACGVDVEILSGTLGKALGGASGGYIAGPAEVVALLRQASRPYLFSNSLAPPIVAASLEAMDILREGGELRKKIRSNTELLRTGLKDLGYQIPESDHPIVPIIFGDAELALRAAKFLAERQILAVAFSFPVVPKGRARIRLQVCAAHETEHINRVLEAFALLRSAEGLPGGE